MKRLLAILLAAAGIAHAAGGVPRPVVKIEAEGKCVAPAEEMRRNHMEMLKHQRDRTLREGVRGSQFSLNGCIECHGKTSGAVTGGPDNFCQGCHSYVAVKLDCWDCHQPKTGQVARTGGRP
jgi:hypothetical protein